MDEGTGILPGLPPVAGKPVHVMFTGGLMTSDAGVLLLAAIEQRLGLAERLAACIEDPTDTITGAHPAMRADDAPYTASPRASIFRRRCSRYSNKGMAVTFVWPSSKLYWVSMHLWKYHCCARWRLRLGDGSQRAYGKG